jgi:hypothetical protein
MADDIDMSPVDHFVRCLLPGLLRQLGVWEGLTSARRREVVEDLCQDLSLDFLENRAALAEMAAAERHQRWFRLVNRRHYDLEVRPLRGRRDVALDSVAVETPSDVDPAALRELLSDADARLAQQLAEGGSRLKNGRINRWLTARSLGLSRSKLRARQAHIAAALGTDDRYLAFWQRRLVEALLGLAADELRDRGTVRLFGERLRRRPDPAGRWHRLQRILKRLQFLPLPPALRVVVALCNRSARDLGHTQASAAAVALAPDDPAAQLWRFESALADGELAAAAAAVRKARECGADAVAVLLARARLLEARGRERLALALLARTGRTRPTDARIAAAVAALQEPCSGTAG